MCVCECMLVFVRVCVYVSVSVCMNVFVGAYVCSCMLY